MYSPQLLWECVKKDSSLIRKPITPNLPWMSTSPANLTGVHSYKFSGQTGSNTFGLTCVKKGKKESIVMIKSGKKMKVRRSATAISKNNKKGLATLEAALAGKFYRKDLLDLAKAKYAKLKTSFKKKKGPASSRRAPKA
eukprot:TRINITY_DN3393_c0_g1_i2.p1 TRINITY_DN3393_c0_g1~~TRINITY_DN3393_c0_g1_i2.p1  ORF type:complete len:139 (+),score=48.26 TRINITY_DN3393_c0_g1_i2:77-493(+)